MPLDESATPLQCKINKWDCISPIIKRSEIQGKRERKEKRKKKRKREQNKRITTTKRTALGIIASKKKTNFLWFKVLRRDLRDYSSTVLFLKAITI